MRVAYDASMFSGIIGNAVVTAGAAFVDPGSLPGLLAWYDMADEDANNVIPGSIYLNPDAVADKSGNGNPMDAGAGRTPSAAQTLNGNRTATFNPTDQFTGTFSGLTMPEDFSIFVVFNRDGGSAQGTAVFLGNTAVAGEPHALFIFNNNGRVSFRQGDASTDAESADNATVFVTTTLIEARANSATSREVLVNNTQVATSTTTRGLTGTTIDNISVGVDNSSSPIPRAYDGQICEIVIVEGGVSDANRTALIEYFDDKWAIPGLP